MKSCAKFVIILILFVLCTNTAPSSQRLPKLPIRLGFNPQPSVSKFPLILEFIVQQIQAHFSNYVFEDLSRPPTWDKPAYTTEIPHDEVNQNETIMTVYNITSNENATVSVEEIDEEEPDVEMSELLFEKIPPSAGLERLNVSNGASNETNIYVGVIIINIANANFIERGNKVKSEGETNYTKV
ncbi:hypothetical protein RI129_005452 [Pyrocoelia pectoralis]|uniref:Uncharacterized protein n=1 Tax=Pyrocoelia pectoralis TaxID=417401 RepID=A0AAN7ZSE4_9COLE